MFVVSAGGTKVQRVILDCRVVLRDPENMAGELPLRLPSGKIKDPTGNVMGHLFVCLTLVAGL